MRQAIALLEGISVQANSRLPKAAIACYQLQRVLALVSSKHFFQTLELEGVPRELKGQVAARAALYKGDVSPLLGVGTMGMR